MPCVPWVTTHPVSETRTITTRSSPSQPIQTLRSSGSSSPSTTTLHGEAEGKSACVHALTFTHKCCKETFVHSRSHNHSQTHTQLKLSCAKRGGEAHAQKPGEGLTRVMERVSVAGCELQAMHPLISSLSPPDERVRRVILVLPAAALLAAVGPRCNSPVLQVFCAAAVLYGQRDGCGNAHARRRPGAPRKLHKPQ
jgi:hypothetical protein